MQKADNMGTSLLPVYRVALAILLPFAVLTLLIMALKTLDQVWPSSSDVGSIAAMMISAVLGFRMLEPDRNKWLIASAYFVVMLPALFYAGLAIVGVVYGDAL